MMVIYDCSLKEAHQYKIALRQPAMWVLYLYIHMSFCVCVCVCMFVCVCVCMLRALSVNGQDILESQPDGCECVPNVFLMCSEWAGHT